MPIDAFLSEDGKTKKSPSVAGVLTDQFIVKQQLRTFST